MMFGYASDETEEYMPYPVAMAHKLARQLTKVRKDGTLTYLRPDGKTQVTVEYNEDGSVKRLDAVVLSTQHDPDVTQEQIHEDIKKYVFDEIIPAELVDEETKFFVNPTGRFVIGGPNGDSGRPALCGYTFETRKSFSREYPWIVSPINFSESPFPYISAVSIKVNPASIPARSAFFSCW